MRKILGAFIAIVALVAPIVSSAQNPLNYWQYSGATHVVQPITSLSAKLAVPATPGGAGCLQIDGSGNITSIGSNCGSSSGSMAIGNVVGSGTAPAVLFIGPGGLLAQDPTNFTYTPAGSFHADITDGATYNSDFLVGSSGASLLVNDINTGTAEILSMDGSHGSTLAATLGLTGASHHADITQATSGWNNGTIFSTSVQDANQSTIDWTSAGVDSQIQAAINRARIQYDNGVGVLSNSLYDATKNLSSWTDSDVLDTITSNVSGIVMERTQPSIGNDSLFQLTNSNIIGQYTAVNGRTSSTVLKNNQAIINHSDPNTLIDTSFQAGLGGVATIAALDGNTGFSSQGIFDPNQYTLKFDDAAGTTAQTYGTSFGTTNIWSDGTAQSYLTTGSGNVHAIYDDGAGDTAQTFWSSSNFNSNFTDAMGYFSQNYGASGQTYQLYQTPYQLIYTNIAGGPFTVGETVTGGTSGATAQITFDNGSTYMIVGSVVGGPFTAGETITGDNIGTTANLSPLQSQEGMYEALWGVAQDATPTGARHAVFINDTTSLIDKLEITHPNQITETVNNTLGTIASLGLDTTQFDLRYKNGLNQESRLTGDATQAFLHFTDPSAMVQNFITLLPDSATMRLRLTPPNSKNGIMQIDFSGDQTYMNFSNGIGSTGSFIATDSDVTSQWTDSGNLTAGIVAGSTGLTITNHDSFSTSYNFTWPVSQGAANSVLTNNGSGVGTWTVPATTTSGTFTPTPTGVTNITAVTAIGGNYTRVGNQVTGYFQILVDPTTTLTFTEYRVALPVSSNFSASSQAGGTCMSGTASESEQIISDGTNDSFLVWATPVNTTSQTYSCTYSYTVI